MRIIRESIIAERIKFNVDAQTYRKYRHGQTRLHGVEQMLLAIGVEVEGIATMQAIPIGEEHYEIVCRGFEQ